MISVFESSYFFVFADKANISVESRKYLNLIFQGNYDKLKNHGIQYLS